VLNICGNSLKTVVKAIPMKLVERMPIVCKAVIKAKGGYLEESNILNIRYRLLQDSMCYFIVLMSSLLFYNVEHSKKIKKNP
jgi:hypothetical protein